MQSEEKKERWKERIKEWEKSGQTQQNRCEEKRYSYTQFKYWKTRIKKEKASGTTKFQYVPVESPFKKPVADPKDLVAIIRIGKKEIEIKGESGQEFLQTLIREENTYV